MLTLGEEGLQADGEGQRGAEDPSPEGAAEMLHTRQILNSAASRVPVAKTEVSRFIMNMNKQA